MSDYVKRLTELKQQFSKMEATDLEAVCQIQPPASLAEIEQAEKSLAISFPLSFRKSLLEMRCRIEWVRGDDEELPAEFDFCSAGAIAWDVGQLVEAELDRRYFVDEVIKIPKNSSDRVWRNKLAILRTDTGDFIALDLGAGDDPPVVILTRDGSSPHGEVLSLTLADFLNEWFGFACVGPSVAAFGDLTNGFSIPFSTRSEFVQPWINWFYNTDK